MRKFHSLTAAGTVAAALAFAPSAQAQGIDVGATCHALLGSGSLALGVANADLCHKAKAQSCSFTDENNLLGLVRIRHGLCINLSELVAKRTVTVGGVAKVRLLP